MTDKRKKRIKLAKKLLFIVFTSYLIVGSLFKYVNTHDKSYLIVPAVLGIFMCWELAYQFFRTGK